MRIAILFYLPATVQIELALTAIEKGEHTHTQFYAGFGPAELRNFYRKQIDCLGFEICAEFVMGQIYRTTSKD